MKDGDLTEKRCNDCDEIKPVAEFYWNVRRWSSRCRKCRLRRDRTRLLQQWADKRIQAETAGIRIPKRARQREVRIWSLVDRRGPNECWPWFGYIDIAGHGREGGRCERAHRVVYKMVRGPIPKDLVLDHMCHTADCRLGTACPHRRCCNPAHLEPRPMTENTRRGAHGPGIRRPEAVRTHCPQGHRYDEANTSFTRAGHRICRECRRRRVSSYETRQREFIEKPRHPQ